MFRYIESFFLPFLPHQSGILENICLFPLLNEIASDLLLLLLIIGGKESLVEDQSSMKRLREQ
jgi:hypothetical protein